MTKAERIRYGKLADMGCVLCRHLGAPGTPSEIHHLRSGQGLGQRAKHDRTIPLCPAHHRQGGIGFHGMGKRAFESAYGVTEMDLLDMTNKILGETECKTA